MSIVFGTVSYNNYYIIIIITKETCLTMRAYRYPENATRTTGKGGLIRVTVLPLGVSSRTGK